LKRLDLDGGAVQPLARIEVGLGATWTHQGEILFSSGPARPIFRVAESGGEVTPVTRVEAAQSGHRYPHVLPDGRLFLYYVVSPRESAGVYVAQIDGSNPRRLLAADSAATYAVSGHLLFVQQATLYAVRFDSATAALSGEPFSIATRIAADSSLGAAAVSASPSGPIVYRQISTPTRHQFVWFDRKGQEIGRLGEADDSGPGHPALSRAGDRLAFTRAHGSNPDVWVLDVAHGRANKFTVEPSTDIYPVWSPDGGRIAFGSNRRGRGGLELFLQSTRRDERASLVAIDGMLTVMPEDWSPDGRFILFRGLRDNNASFDRERHSDGSARQRCRALTGRAGRVLTQSANSRNRRANKAVILGAPWRWARI
jgi:hypothetical protein